MEVKCKLLFVKEGRKVIKTVLWNFHSAQLRQTRTETNMVFLYKYAWHIHPHNAFVDTTEWLACAINNVDRLLIESL